MSGAIFDALLGRVYVDGVELELGAGIDLQAGLTATRNSSNQRIEISPSPSVITRASADWTGDATTVSSGASTEDLALDGSSTTIDVADLADVGDAVELRTVVWVAAQSGNAINRDELRFAVYLEETSSEVHLLDLSQSGSDSVGTGSQNITLTGANSGLDYTITVSSFSGQLSIALAEGGSTVVAQATTHLGTAWTVPYLII